MMGPLVAEFWFKFLRGVSTASCDDWTVIVSNLRKASLKWDRMSNILVY